MYKLRARYCQVLFIWVKVHSNIVKKGKAGIAVKNITQLHTMISFPGYFEIFIRYKEKYLDRVMPFPNP